MTNRSRLFTVIRTRGAAWDDARGMEQQDDWDAHASFMNALVREGFVVLGGPRGVRPDRAQGAHE
jgi:hypothetical protein